MKRKHFLLMVALAFVVGLLAQSLYAAATEVGVESSEDETGLEGGDLGASAVGADSGDLKFVPIEPCRVVDTRPTAAGAMAPNTTRSFEISGATGFPAQGGTSGGCGIPFPTAVAVHLNLTAVDPTGAGFMRAWPFGSPAPNATILNYSTALNASNAATVAICDAATGATCTRDLSVRNFGSTSHLVVDAFGFYVEPMFALVGPTGSLSTNSRAVSSVRNSVGDYTVTFDRPISECVVMATRTFSAGEIGAIAGFPSDSSVTVRTWNSAGTLTDSFFRVHVIC